MAKPRPLIIGRYALFDEIAAGGMATVHIGRLIGAAGFSRVVAIKRLHRQYAKHPEFVSMLIDEARLAARIRHPNVVPTLDVVRTDDELFLVMEYVQGESLSRLLRGARDGGKPPEPRIAAAIISGTLHGLHAAHTAKGERGEALEIVHRDVSPQNVIVGTDGVARVLDFGIAKASGRLQTTREGQIKGKLAYMAPEQLAGGKVGPYTDVYAAAAVLWEALAGRRLFDAEHEAALLALVLGGVADPPSTHAPGLPAVIDEIVMRGLAIDPTDRFPTAREMAVALEKGTPLAVPTEIGQWVEELASAPLSLRAERISAIESQTDIKSLIDVLAPARKSGAPLGDEAPGGDEDDAEPPSDARSRRDPQASEDATFRSASSSQLSSISVARSFPAERARRPMRVRLALGIGAGALLAGGFGAYLLLRDFPPPDGRAIGPSASTAEPVGARSTLPTETPAAASAQPGAGASKSATAEGAAGSSQPSVTGSAAAVPDGGRPTRPSTQPKGTAAAGTAPSATPGPAGAQCNPPYTVDAQGLRHIKPECLR